MTGPHCHRKIPDRALLAEAGRILRAQAKTPGRKPVMRKCPKCGVKHSAREMRRCKG